MFDSSKILIFEEKCYEIFSDLLWLKSGKFDLLTISMLFAHVLVYDANPLSINLNRVILVPFRQNLPPNKKHKEKHASMPLREVSEICWWLKIPQQAWVLSHTDTWSMVFVDPKPHRLFISNGYMNTISINAFKISNHC